MADEKKTYTFRCTVCGYEVTIDEPELPEDYVCPVCGVSYFMVLYVLRSLNSCALPSFPF